MWYPDHKEAPPKEEKKKNDIRVAIIEDLVRFLAVKYVKLLLKMSAKDMLRYRLAPPHIVLTLYRHSLQRLNDLMKELWLTDFLEAIKKEFHVYIPPFIMWRAKFFDRWGEISSANEIAEYFYEGIKKLKGL